MTDEPRAVVFDPAFPNFVCVHRRERFRGYEGKTRGSSRGGRSTLRDPTNVDCDTQVTSVAQIEVDASTNAVAPGSVRLRQASPLVGGSALLRWSRSRSTRLGMNGIHVSPAFFSSGPTPFRLRV